MTDVSGRKKQKIACCAIMKNESPYLHEWVAHYLGLGFNEIFVYENDSSDKTPSHLKNLEKSGYIRFVSWPSLDKASPQLSAYEDALSKTDADWMLFCDADEFLILNQHENVHQFMEKFDEDISSVSVNWRVFGSSGKESRQPGLVIERFQLCSELNFDVNRHVKSFVRPARVTKIHIHAPVTDGQSVYADGSPLQFKEGEQGIAPEVKADSAVLNHYFTKTKEEWQIKKLRGNANRSLSSKDKYIRYHEGLFERHDRNEVLDTAALKYLDSIKETMKKFQPY